MLPVRQRAAIGHRDSQKNNHTLSLSFVYLSSAGFGDSVLAFLDALNEVPIDKLRELLTRPCLRDVEIKGDNRRRNDRKGVRLVHTFKDTVLCARHPLRAIPESHLFFYFFPAAYSYFWFINNILLLLNRSVNKFNTLAYREHSNDSPGEVGAQKAPGRAWHRSDPVGRLTAMSDNDLRGRKGRTKTVASSEISFDASATLRGAYDDIRLEAGR